MSHSWLHLGTRVESSIRGYQSISGAYMSVFVIISLHGPLARYVQLRVVHAPGMPGRFSTPLRVSDPDMHHGTCVTRVPWRMPGSLTSGFLWSRRQGKRSRHPRRMRKPQVSGKRPIIASYCISCSKSKKTLSNVWRQYYVCSCVGYPWKRGMLVNILSLIQNGSHFSDIFNW